MRRLVVWLLFASCAPAPREAAPARERTPPAARSIVESDASPHVGDAETIDATQPAVTAIPKDAGAPDAEAVLTACPITWAKGGALCKPAGKKCEFPEGTCTCAPQSYCGGAAPPPDLVASLRVPRWICEPSPKVLGPDGCPLGIPNGACSTPGKKCHYTPCCAMTVTCTGGTWVPGGMSCPP